MKKIERIEVFLPSPPSANKLWRRSGNRMHRSNEYIAWMKTALEELMVQRPGHIISGENGLEVHLEISKHHALADLDNRIKPCLDALQKGGVIENDNLIERISAEWTKDEALKRAGGCLITIKQMEAEMNN